MKTNVYYKALCEHYTSIKDTYYKGVLQDLKLATWFSFFRVRSKEMLSEADKKTINSFILNQQGEVNQDSFRPIISFLTSATNFRYIETADLLAFLIDYSPRPYSLFLKTPEDKELDRNEPLVLEQKKIINKKPIVITHKESESIEVNNEQNNLIQTKKTFPNKILIRMLSVLGVLVMVLYIINTLTILLGKDKVDINNFNTENNYYYYLNDGKLDLISSDKKSLIQKVNASPITPRIMDEYFDNTGTDTTSSGYHVVKANYFAKYHTPPIVDKKEIRVVDTSVVGTFGEAKQVPAKLALKNTEKDRKEVSNQVVFKIKNKEVLDMDLLNAMQQVYPSFMIDTICKEPNGNSLEGISKYTFKPSTSDSKRYICELELSYRLTNGNTTILKEAKVIAAGFSESSAKDNAIKKIVLQLK